MLTNEIILSFIPNYIASGFNERSMLDRLAPYVSGAEAWTGQYVADESVLDSIDNPELRNKVLSNLQATATIRLLLDAAPMLDVTLHPNGLAVVNTDSLAPASTARVQEFKTALERQLIRFASLVISDLAANEAWRDSFPGRNYWTCHMFTTPESIVTSGIAERRWDDIMQSISAIVCAELLIAENYISRELMLLLDQWEFEEIDRKKYLESLKKSLLPLVAGTAKWIRKEGIEVELPAACRPPALIETRLFALVEHIKKNPLYFPEWHRSKTANLFYPPKFVNKKSSGGYFF